MLFYFLLFSIFFPSSFIFHDFFSFSHTQKQSINTNSGKVIMWPRLAANKFLRGRGTNNTVADFPSGDSSNIIDHHNESQTYKVFVSTWNVGGFAPNRDMNYVMQDWLDTTNTTCDIYVLGFQEIVPLIATNVVRSENVAISMTWNSIIKEALNNNQRREQENNDKEDQFECISSKQMVGIFISVWVRINLRPYIRNPTVSLLGCGIMGYFGNKGSIAVRFWLHETSFCFVCVHLASGDRQADRKQRNSDATQIFSRTRFSNSRKIVDQEYVNSCKITDHNRVVLLGDLNYRISLQKEATRLLSDKREWDTLLKNDQLKMELMEGQVFQDWYEGDIDFAPTYKYHLNSDKYFGSDEGKKFHNSRAPAWCDRIIWYREGLKQLIYKRGESKFSDHRPVKSIFIAQVGVPRTTISSFRSDDMSGPTLREQLYNRRETSL